MRTLVDSESISYVSGELKDTSLLNTPPALDILHEEVLDDGVVVRHVRTDDLYAPVTAAEHENYEYIQSTIQAFEQRLRSDDLQEVQQAIEEGRAFLDASETVRKWKEYIPTAMALYPLQRPNAPTMLDGTPIDDLARQLFLYGQDARAIRLRGTLFGNLLRSRDGKVAKIFSLAGGAAVAECDAIAQMFQKPEVLVVDNDSRALGYVEQIVVETGMESNYRTEEIDLVGGFVLARDGHPSMPAAGCDLANALGITEYFQKRFVRAFLQKSYSLVRPGGSLIFANMLDEHPTLNFHKQIIEWRGVQPRSQAELIAIARTVADRPEDITLYIPDDKVYAVIEIEKPSLSQLTTRILGKNALVS